MTPEKQRIAIAEVCGWGNVHFDYLDEEAPGDVCGIPPRNVGKNKNHDIVPDYPNDLNAMHEAETIIGDSIWEDYRDALCGVCATDCSIDNKRTNQWWRATAAQRAKALLKTIGKWEDA